MGFVYEPSTSINDSQESALLALSNDLNTLNANYPEIDLSSFSSHITQLLTSMDDINLQYTQNEQLNLSRAIVKSLENKLQLKNRLRRDAIDSTLKLQDQATFESIAANEPVESLKVALRQNELQLSAVFSDKVSLKSELDKMTVCTKTLEDEIKKLNSVISNVNFQCDVANKETNALSSLLNDKWVEDHTLDNARLCGWKLFGPAISQLLKLGDKKDISTVIKSSSYVSCKFAFIIVSNSNNPEIRGSGSHWSLLFVDRINNQAFHLDSLSGVNDESALKIFEGLNIPVNNFFSNRPMAMNAV